MEKSSRYDKGAFRIHDWWWSKAAFLMTMIYLFTLRYAISFTAFVPLSLLSLTTIIGFASFGYLCNDLFDIQKDAVAGKRNFLAGKSITLIAGLFIVSAAFIFLPWIFLPKTGFSLFLIAVQLFMFALYSIPPVRLKERGLAGIVTDAFYAHSVPVFLAAYTYSLAAGTGFITPDIVLLFLWQSISGIRNILLHQAEDKEADKKSNSNNFVSTLSEFQFARLLKMLIGLELALCIGFFALLSFYNNCFLIALIVAACLVLNYYLKSGSLTNIDAESVFRYFPNNVYEKWLAPAILLPLGLLNSWFFLVLALHLAIFNFNFYAQVADKIWGRYMSIPIKGRIITVRIFLSYPVNNFLYYTFKIFSVDLKKQNISALAFLLSKVGIKSAGKRNS